MTPIWLALSRYDDGHGADDERRVTLGQAETGALLVVVHTFADDGHDARIRIISARPATAHEQRQYQHPV